MKLAVLAETEITDLVRIYALKREGCIIIIICTMLFPESQFYTSAFVFYALLGPFFTRFQRFCIFMHM